MFVGRKHGVHDFLEALYESGGTQEVSSNNIEKDLRETVQ